IKLAPSGLGKYFSFGGFGEDGYLRTDLLKKAVARAEKISGLKIKPSQVYVIGDTEKDILAGKELGFHTAAVTCGFGAKESIFSAGPEFIAKDFRNLNMWLVWLGLKKDSKGVERGCYIFPDSPIEHAHYGRTGIDEAQLKLLRKNRRRHETC
ncbi:MAG: HAD hydrolase-like protein, partial [Elusimicrobia bacterium]|nr:HAD hydrolase-like protein [Elusimicrobiota bacterium]